MRIVKSINFEINSGTDVKDAAQVAFVLSQMNGGAPVTFKHNGVKFTAKGFIIEIKSQTKQEFEMRKEWLEDAFEGYIVKRAK